MTDQILNTAQAAANTKLVARNHPHRLENINNPLLLTRAESFFERKSRKLPAGPRSQIPAEETDHLTSFATLDTSAGMMR